MAADRPGKRANEIGIAGRWLAENVRDMRAERRLSTRQLAERMAEHGRPIPATGITRIEAGQRRVDADDLVALALSLGVTPNRLLLPPTPVEDEVHLTPNLSAPWAAVWRWAHGEQPLLQRDEELPLDDPKVREFIRANRPYEQRPIREAWMYLNKLVPAPFEATITHEKANLSHRVEWEEWVDGVNRGDR